MQSRSVEWNLVELVKRLNELFVAPLGAMFLTGIVSRRVTAGPALLGFAAGSATSILVAFRKEIFQVDDSISFMWIMPLSFVVSVTVTLVAGALGGKAAQPELDQAGGSAAGD